MDVINHLRLRVQVIREGIAAKANVTQKSQRGDPLGSPPGIGAGAKIGNLYAGGDGFAAGRYIPGEQSSIEAPDVSLVARIPPRRHPAIILDDIKEGELSVTRTNDALWWDSQHPQQDLFVGRHTRTAIDGYASLKAWGSSSTASGPEGTLVLFPPRFPRSLASARSIAGSKRANILLNYANDHFSIPDVPVSPAYFSGRGAP